MEIQFTIKLVGSRGSAAVLTDQPGDQNTVVEGKSLAAHKGAAENPEHTSGKGGGVGDDPGPGHGGAGTGQVIVIGPIAICCAGSALHDGKGGGAGDDAGPGHGKPTRSR